MHDGNENQPSSSGVEHDFGQPSYHRLNRTRSK